MGPPFIHQNRVRMDFHRERQCRRLARIQARRGAYCWQQREGRLLSDSIRQLQTDETRGAAGQPRKLCGDFRRDDHLLKQLAKQAALTDATKIDEDRSIRDNDHLGNTSLRDWMSEASICSV
jgi:hypothetical protein